MCLDDKVRRIYDENKTSRSSRFNFKMIFLVLILDEKTQWIKGTCWDILGQCVKLMQVMWFKKMSLRHTWSSWSHMWPAELRLVQHRQRRHVREEPGGGAPGARPGAVAPPCRRLQHRERRVSLTHKHVCMFQQQSWNSWKNISS